MKQTLCLTVLTCLLGVQPALANSIPPPADAGSATAPAPPAAEVAGRSLFERRYREGETLRYRMSTSHISPEGTLRYTALATISVGKAADGRMVESVAWSDLVRNGTPMTLTADAQKFRQTLSRAPGFIPSLPDLSRAPQLTGPICDLLTFYADLFLAGMLPLRKPGDTAAVPMPRVNPFGSTPDHLIAEDSVDFALTLVSIDRHQQRAELQVRHLPPPEPRVRLPAEWMKEPVGNAPNNWVQVVRVDANRCVGEVGHETFDVRITLDLTDGKILQARMDNLVDVRRRSCALPDYSARGNAEHYQIRRQIDLELLSEPRT